MSFSLQYIFSGLLLLKQTNVAFLRLCFTATGLYNEFGFISAKNNIYPGVCVQMKYLFIRDQPGFCTSLVQTAGTWGFHMQSLKMCTVQLKLGEYM